MTQQMTNMMISPWCHLWCKPEDFRPSHSM